MAGLAIRNAVERSPIEMSEWRPNVWLLLLNGAALLGVLLGVVLALTLNRGPLAPYEYHLWRWEADTLIGNGFARLGIGPDPDELDGEAAIQQYFKLTTQIRGAQQLEPFDAALVDALVGERSAYENDVERYIEKLVSGAVEEAGLQRALPLFNSIQITWPPVDLELTSPPRVLIRSPRDEIARAGDTLLKPDITFADIEAIEERTDSEDVVTLVVPIGGLAAYPAIINSERTYGSLLETAAHEWVHHYLAFYPLGREWGRGGDAYTLNETTANIAGRELARVAHSLHPIELPAEEDGRAPPVAAAAISGPPIDFSKTMRQLRIDVDALLAGGRVAEAEALMEQRRLDLEAGGYSIRKINQAYFAFYGTYADTPQGGDNPIGRKIERIWEITQDVGFFLAAMRDVRNVADLDAVLAKLEAAVEPQ